MENEPNLTKKQKTKLKRDAKEKEAQSKKTRRNITLAIAGVAAAGVVYGITILVDGSNANRPGEIVEVVSPGRHLESGLTFDGYNSNPPTSGPHSSPVRWGVSQAELLDENLVHNLEHGGIWISYKDLDQQSVEMLQSIARKNARSVVLSPRSANDANIAIASWGRLLQLETVDAAQINDFIKQNINKSPERLAK